MNVHQKPRAGILLEVDLSVRPESYYYYYYHSLGVTRIQFHPPKVKPLTNPAKVTDQVLCYCNSDSATLTLLLHNSHQSGVIIITDQLIFQNGKKLRSVQEEQ